MSIYVYGLNIPSLHFHVYLGDILIFGILDTYCVIGFNGPTAKTIMKHGTGRLQSAGSPAVDNNGLVSSSPLYHQHMLNDCHDGRRRGAPTLGGPAGHLELSHLVLLARLQEKMQI